MKKNPTIHKNIVPVIHEWGVSALTIHGRSRLQRYRDEANWDYINMCAGLSKVPVIGNGDIYSWEDAANRLTGTNISAVMVARGAIIKPWIFTEIKEKRHYDISSKERLEIIKDFCNYGLEHWGSDDRGVETTRNFLLQWISFLHRYVPVGLLEVLPPKLNHRPLQNYGRDDLESMLASADTSTWIKISEMFLGPAPEGFTFEPKHKSPSYSQSDFTSSTQSTLPEDTAVEG